MSRSNGGNKGGRGTVLQLPQKEAQRQQQIQQHQAQQADMQRKIAAQKISLYQERYLVTLTALASARDEWTEDLSRIKAEAKEICDSAYRALPPGMAWDDEAPEMEDVAPGPGE